MNLHEWIESLKQDKGKRKSLLVAMCAVLLAIACYFVFFYSNGQSIASVETMSVTESKLCETLSDIEGVGKITAYVNEDANGKALSCVLIMEGAERLTVRLDVMKAAALALGIEQKDVLIYKMNES